MRTNIKPPRWHAGLAILGMQFSVGLATVSVAWAGGEFSDLGYAKTETQAIRAVIAIIDTVIVFDEISNMGGRNRAQKESLFKKLYSIFEEGTWLSPASNKTYELSPYMILNTGNDLENLFQGSSTDESRLKIWEQFKLPSKLRSLLAKTGVPEAFLGRMSDIILMKPLQRAELNFITRKLFKELVTAFYGEKGIEIQPHENLRVFTVRGG